MAKPRIFISSTYYDLKHLRSSLDIFVESLGFEPVLSEKGDIAYTPDVSLDKSCYREVENADIFVLLIGGRYGSESSGKKKKPPRTFFERYDSITKKEYEEAVSKDIPTYILIESSVYSEYHTYLRNKTNSNIDYAHVDSVNIFKLIEDILAKPRNNPTHTFERFSDIENWLREQWAGLFKELLQRMSNQKQISTLSSQVEDLKEINNTLKRYLEGVMRGITPDDSIKLIEIEEKRLEERIRREQFKSNDWSEYIRHEFEISIDELEKATSNAKSFYDFAKLIGTIKKAPEVEKKIRDTFDNSQAARSDFNSLRKILDLKTFRSRPKKKP